jgi:hypothetical protein
VCVSACSSFLWSSSIDKWPIFKAKKPGSALKHPNIVKNHSFTTKISQSQGDPVHPQASLEIGTNNHAAIAPHLRALCASRANLTCHPGAILASVPGLLPSSADTPEGAAAV